MNTTFKKVALVSALMATTAIVTPQMAFAAELAPVGANTINAVGAYIAPVDPVSAAKTPNTPITPTLGYGEKLNLVYPATVLGASTAAPTYYLYYYDANGAFLFADAGKTGPIGAGSVSTTLISSTVAKSVAIVVQAGGTDTIGNVTNGFGVINTIQAGGSATQVSYTVTPLAVPANANPSAVGQAAAPSKIALTNYAGPLITSAGKKADGAFTGQVTVYASMPLKGAAQNAPVDDSLTVLKNNGLPISETPSVAVATSDGALYVQITGSNGTNGFGNGEIVSQVKPTYNANATLADLAGNGLAWGQNNVPVNVFANPKLKSATAPVVVTGVTGGTINALLNGTLGDAVTLNVTALFAENLASQANVANVQADFQVAAPASVSISSALPIAANSRSVVLTLTGSGGAKWGVNSSGQLTYGGAVVNIQGAYNGNAPLANAAPNSQSWGINGNGPADAQAGVPATPIEIGVAPVPVAATLDNGHTGLINGASVDFGAPLATVPPVADFSVNTAFGQTARSIPVTTSLATGSTSKVNLVISSPTTVDWNENGTPGEAADAALYNTTYFNTGVSSGSNPSVKYSVALAASPSDTYASIYDPTTGELAKIGSPNVTSTASPLVLNDGASPVLLSTASNGATYQAGTQTLTLKFSENIQSNSGANVGQNILIDNVPLGVFDLNAGVTTAPAVTGTTATTLSISPVAALTTTDSVTIGTSPASLYGDAAGNPIASSTTATNISIVNDQPKLINAFLVKDATSGKTTGVVAQYSKAVQANAAGTLDNIFTVRALYNGNQYTDFVLPASSVTISGAYVSLTLPAALPSTVGALLVSYNASGNNKLTSTETTGAQDAVTGLGTTDLGSLITVAAAQAYGGDADTQYVHGSSNSLQLYSQTLTGTLAGFPKGTLLQAYVVGNVNQFNAGSDSSVSYTTAAGAKVTTQVNLGKGLPTTLNAAAAAGTTSVPATLEINTDNNVSAVGATLFAQTNFNAASTLAGGVTLIPVTINTSTGAITGTNASSGVSGTLSKVITPSVLGDTANIIVNQDTTTATGSPQTFTVSVGVNQTVANGFVQIAYKLPGTTTTWVPLYNGDSSLSNYQSFQADINASGKPVAVGTISPSYSQVITLAILPNTWQVVGAQGTVSLVKGASPSVKIDAKPFFTGIDPTTGLLSNVFDAVTATGRQAFDQQAFTLSANKVASAIDLSSTTLINTLNYAPVPANPAFAVQTDGATQVAIAVPVTGSAGTTNLAAGWSLVTASGSNIPSGISAIIQAGNGNQVNTWFRSATSTTAPSWLTAGAPVFVYASSAIPNFTYFK